MTSRRVAVKSINYFSIFLRHFHIFFIQELYYIIFQAYDSKSGLSVFGDMSCGLCVSTMSDSQLVSSSMSLRWRERGEVAVAVEVPCRSHEMQHETIFCVRSRIVPSQDLYRFTAATQGVPITLKNCFMIGPSNSGAALKAESELKFCETRFWAGAMHLIAARPHN